MATDEIGLRQLRAWAVETALGKAATEGAHCEEHHTIDVNDIIKDAKVLLRFVVNG